MSLSCGGGSHSRQNRAQALGRLREHLNCALIQVTVWLQTSHILPFGPAAPHVQSEKHDICAGQSGRVSETMCLDIMERAWCSAEA